jgi:hypothetical protein
LKYVCSTTNILTVFLKLITARRQLKGQNVSISEELTKLNFQLSEKLQEHNLFEEAWCQKRKKGQLKF